MVVCVETFRCNPPEVFLGTFVMKICSKFTGKHTCRSAISVKLHSYFFEITLRHGCSPVNLLHIFRTPFSKNTSGGLLPKPSGKVKMLNQNCSFLLNVIATQRFKKLLKNIWFYLVFLKKSVQKICSKFTREYSCQKAKQLY